MDLDQIFYLCVQKEEAGSSKMVIDQHSIYIKEGVIFKELSNY